MNLNRAGSMKLTQFYKFQKGLKMLKNLSNLQKRIVGAGLLLFFGISFFADLFINPLNNYIAIGIYYIFSAGIIWELINLIEDQRTKTLGKLFLSAIFLSILIFQNHHDFFIADYLLVFSLFITYLIITFIKRRHEFKKKLFDILAIIIYFGALIFINKAMNFLPLKIPSSLGAILLLVVFVITITTDIGAYFIGKKFGKKKFSPKISPNKTWAGFFGGFLILASIGFVITFFQMIMKTNAGDEMNYLAPFGVFFGIAILSITAQLGDLFESYLKRLNGVKDSGNIIIGHGGLLDRFDSFLFLIFCIAIVMLIVGIN